MANDATPPINVMQKTVMVVRSTHVMNPTLGAATMYIGPAQPIQNGISSMRTQSGGTLKLLPSTPVRVCTRPTVPFGTAEPSVRIHFLLRVKGHSSNCQCGACGCVSDLTNVVPEPCSCGTDVYDEGKELKCAIM